MKGIYQAGKTGTVRNRPDSCRESLFVCMMGKSVIETKGKEQEVVESINNEWFACAGSVIGRIFHNTQ